MKKSILTISFVASFLLFFTSCDKDDSPATAVTDYSPSTRGSNWTYRYTEGATVATFKMTAIKDTTLNNKAYKIYTNDLIDTTYMAKSGNDYYRFQSFPAIGINNFEELYLKDNLDVNGTWRSSASINYSGFVIPVTLDDTIKGKGETRTVEGTTYNDVIHVKLGIVTSLFGNVGGGDFYYAKGVGLIEDNILVTPPAAFGSPYSSSQTLLSYKISK